MPRAIAPPNRSGQTQALIDASQQPQPVEHRGFMQPGFPSLYRPNTHRGIAVLGQLNGVWWMNRTDGVTLPPEWPDFVDRAPRRSPSKHYSPPVRTEP